MKGETDSSTIIVEDFNAPLIIMAKKKKKEHKKGNRVLNTVKPTDLTDIHRALYNRLHLLLKCTLDIFQDRSHVRLQIKSQ